MYRHKRKYPNIIQFAVRGTDQLIGLTDTGELWIFEFSNEDGFMWEPLCDSLPRQLQEAEKRYQREREDQKAIPVKKTQPRAPVQ